MAVRRRSARSRPDADPSEAVGETTDVVRRAPFSVNPKVGPRGQQAQQRILDAALEVFGEQAYELCGIDAITRRAGCSRAAFYQYFSSKEDVFRQLTGRVARQLDASTEAMEPLASSASGWRALRDWVARYSEIYRRYEPMFHAFQAASERDERVATGSVRWSARSASRLRARIAGSALRPRELEPVVQLLLECVARTHDVARILRSSAPGHHGEARVGDALADVVHRSLFGLRDALNVHAPPARRPPAVRFDPGIRRDFAREGADDGLTPTGRRTRDALLEAGRKAFVEHGYHRTRVSDVTDAAGVSHGAFYRYFDNQQQLARALTTRAIRSVSRVFAEVPASATSGSVAGRTALRRWLRRYNLTQANEATMLRVWVDAALKDPALRASSAPALDWGRRAMASFLAPRGFGDVDTEGLVMVALLSAFGARERTRAELDAAVHIVEHGLLGFGRD